MNDKLLSCLGALIILLLGCFFILWFIGFRIPFDKGVVQIHSYRSSSVAGSKEVGAFICEYEPVDIIYKDVAFSVDSAFAEHAYRLYEEYPDSVFLYNDHCRVRISFGGWEQLRFKGYNNTWIIEKEMSLLTDGIINYDYKMPVPPDTITLYIRECHPTLDSIGARFYYDALECDVHWDTIQSFQLIKKNSYLYWSCPEKT